MESAQVAKTEKWTAKDRIIGLWVVGAVLTVVGGALFRSETTKLFSGPSEGALLFATLLFCSGAVALQVAMIATGVRLGRRD